MLSKAADRFVLLALASLLTAGCDGSGLREGRDPSTPSGFPVPRYVSLKFNEVNGRSGPTEENRVLWTYKTAGLPVQVIAETSDWRRICDPDGGVAWVKKSQIDGARRVMAIAQADVVLRRKADAAAAATAYLRPRALASLEACEGGWCRLKSGEARGWAPAAELWGVAPEPQCRGAAPGKKAS
jgi:SH3-like domain-containing protein